MLIDATDLILGRLASFVAKKALLGQEIIIVNSEKAVITGNKKDILRKYQRKIEMGDVFKGPFISRTPEKILRRTIRSMLPYKKPKGKTAFKRIKCFINIPEKYKNEKLETVKEANISKVSNIKHLKLEELSKMLGK